MRIRVVLAAFLALVVGGSARAQVSDRQVIEELLYTFQTAFNGRDTATLASLYADDAVLMPPGMPLVRGRAAVDAAAKSIAARGGLLHFDPPVVEVTGTHAHAAGTYTVTVSAADAQGSMVFHAKYLTVFKRVGKDWKIAYDMQNADEAPAR